MKKYIFLLIISVFFTIKGIGQDVGISGSFYASMISISDESELHVTFTNNSFDTPIPAFGAYVQIDFPTTGEYSAPVDPPTGPGADNFIWTFTAPNIWVGLVNTAIPVLSSHLFIFTVVGEEVTNNTATILFTDLSSGSDNDPQNNNAEPILAIQGALPVQIIDFTSKSLDCEHVILNWSTAVEVNNSGFEVLFSENGKHYENIGFVNGKGNSQSISEYSFIHKISNGHKINPAVHYRLKQIDYNGLFSMSEIVDTWIDCDQNDQYCVIGPNPTNGNLNFIFNQALISNAEVTIINSSEQIVENFVIESSTLNYNKNIRSLPKGVYAIFILSEGLQHSQKIILID